MTSRPVSHSLLVPALLALLTLLASACARPSSDASSSPGDLATSQPLFEAVASHAVHAKPWTLRALDVDADGDRDVVVGGESITVLVNDGAGELAPGATFADLEQAIDFALADFDADGALDLAVAEHDAPQPQFLVLHVDAAGTLRPFEHSPFVVDAEPHLHTLAALDFDADGHADIVTDSWPESRLVLVRGLGDGRFDLPGTQLAVPEVPMQNLAAADLNGDGRIDVVTPAHDRKAMTVLLADGAGSFASAPGSPVRVHGGFTTVALGDAEGDGDVDVFAVHRSDQSTQYKTDAFSLLLNDGAGRFTHAPASPYTDLPDRSNDLALGDFDGDGLLDVAVLGETDAELALLRGTQDGLQHVGRQRFDGRVRGIAAGDLDGDGRAELLASDHAAGRVRMLRLRADAAEDGEGPAAKTE